MHHIVSHGWADSTTSLCVSGGGWKGVGVGVGVGVGAHTYSVRCERTPVCRSKLATRCNFLHWLD